MLRLLPVKMFSTIIASRFAEDDDRCIEELIQSNENKNTEKKHGELDPNC